MDATAAEDPQVAKLLQPYADKVEALETLIGFAAEDLKKDQPEGKLGNFVADLLLAESKRLFGQPADVSFANNGGLRVPISRGEISQRTIWELMPFENKVVLLELSASELRQLAERITSLGGQPMAGMTLEMTRDRKLSNVKIRGAPIEEGRNYRVITLDYLAQGNGGFFETSQMDRAQNSNALFRDVIIDHIRARNSAPISGVLDGRIRIIN